MANDNAKKILRDFADLKSRRTNFDSVWQEVSDLVWPLRDFTRHISSGTERHLNIFDTTAAQAMDELASGIFGLTINPAIKWFKLVMNDESLNEDDEVRAWLDDAENRMFLVINSPESNFYVQAHEMILDLVNFGTGALFTRDAVTSFVSNARPMNEIYIREDKNGMVDSVFRQFQLSHRQALQEFGANSPTSLIEKARKDPETRSTYVHAVFPRSDRNVGMMNNKNFPFASVWIDEGGNHTLREGGFLEFPYMVPRWFKGTSEEYGQGPSMKMLPSVRMINSMKRAIIRGAQLAINPPIVVDDDSMLAPIRTVPTSIIYKRRGSEIKPLLTGARPDIGEALLDRERDAIRRGYFLHLFQIPETDRMTAFEVSERVQKQMQELADKASRIQREFLRPFVIRTFKVMIRRGAFRPPPPQLSLQSFEVDFQSPLAVSQRASDVNAFIQLIRTIQPLHDVGMPVYDNVAGDDATRKIARILSVPQGFLRNTPAVQELRQLQAEVQQKNLQLQQQQAEASIAKDTGKATKDLAQA